MRDCRQRLTWQTIGHNEVPKRNSTTFLRPISYVIPTMKTNLPRQFLLQALVPCLGLTLLAGCGANTDSSVATGAAQSAPASTPEKEPVAPARKVDVMTVFKPALGSGGNGLAMTELKKHGGQLRDPDAKYDVFDPETTADAKTIKQSIQASLDRGNRVLIDSDGTPESRAKAAQMSYDAVGGSLPDNTAFLIMKIPEEKGGGVGLIPIYTRAEVAAEVAAGRVSKPEDLNNSLDNFFFEPPKSAQ